MPLPPVDWRTRKNKTPQKTCPKCYGSVEETVLACDCGYRFFSDADIKEKEKKSINRNKAVRIIIYGSIVIGGLVLILSLAELVNTNRQILTFLVDAFNFLFKP